MKYRSHFQTKTTVFSWKESHQVKIVELRDVVSDDKTHDLYFNNNGKVNMKSPHDQLEPVAKFVWEII